MRGNVVVEEESAFQEWLQEQTTFAQSVAEASEKDGVKLASSEAAINSASTGPTR